MIPKGNLHAHGGRLATYITKGEDGEQAELVEMRGFAATDLREAFCDIQAIAESQTQCEKPFFHAYVRLPADESLTRDQWFETANRIEAKLGFDDQPRGVALHFLEDGTTHMHVAWSRIDTDAMKAIDPGLYLRKMKEVCRELEVEFGLHQVPSDRGPERLTKEPKRPEFEEARRLGMDVEKTRETIRDCYSRSDNGPSFKAALAEHGFDIAQGDRRDFVVIDSEGGKHALGKSICGDTSQQIRQRFGQDFKESLLTVREVADQMQARRDGAPQVTPVRQTRDEIKVAVTTLWTASDTGKTFVTGLGEHGYSLARGDRRDFVLIDAAGDTHSLPRVIQGARVADVREKLRDIDPASLPTVAEAKATIESRAVAPVTAPRPLASLMAAEVRAEWALHQTGAWFAAALRDRGYMLAQISPGEAEASRQRAAIAEAVGRTAPLYTAGEFVVVNGLGDVFRFTESAAGKSEPEIASYLSTVDRSALLSATSARSAMRWESQRRLQDEFGPGRPPTKIETAIKTMLEKAKDGEAFAVAVATEELILTRATAGDITGLAAVYEAQRKDHEAMGTRAPSGAMLRIKEGDIVAVNRFGGLHRLNPDHVDGARCEALMIEAVGPQFGRFASVIEVRGEVLTGRADVAAQWSKIRAERDATPDRRPDEPFHTKSKKARVVGAIRATGAVVSPVGSVIGKVADAIGKVAEAISDIFMPPAPLTAAQMEANERALQRQAEAAVPIREARALSEDEERRAAIAKAQAAMEDALRQSQAEQDKRRNDDYGYERTR